MRRGRMSSRDTPSGSNVIMSRLALLMLMVCSQVFSACASGTDPNERTSAGGGASGGAQVLNIAHRGASGKAPENTFAAYDLALDSGADYIEQDVRLTRDGVLVVLHDETLDRTARGPEENCTGPVNEKTLNQIKTCDVGSRFNEEHPRYAREEYEDLEIPTLGEVFRRYRDRGNFYVDVKGALGAGEKLLRLMDEYGLREPADERRRVIVVSFDQDSLRELHALAPSLPLTQAYPASDSSESIKKSLKSTREYAIGINSWRADVSADLVEAAHDQCLEVYPYVVNDAPRIKALIDVGVDGMFTAFPSRLDGRAGEGAASARKPTACQTDSLDQKAGRRSGQIVSPRAGKVTVVGSFQRRHRLDKRLQ